MCCGLYSLAEQSEPPQAVQKLAAAALVEVQRRERGRLLQSEDEEGPPLLLHGDRSEVSDVEGECPAAPLVAVVQRPWWTHFCYSPHAQFDLKQLIHTDS